MEYSVAQMGTKTLHFTEQPSKVVIVYLHRTLTGIQTRSSPACTASSSVSDP